MENNLYLQSLYPRLISRQISEEELEWLLKYFEKDNFEDLYEVIRIELDLSDEDILEFVPTVQELTAGENIYKRIKLEISKEHIQKPRGTKLWLKIAIAASVIFAVFTVGYFHFVPQTRILKNRPIHANVILPGRNAATLILASGKKIVLSDVVNGELAKESGVSISKTENGKLVYQIRENGGNTNEINTLTTARGETYDIILPDQTKVTLNASSSLKYPTNFSNFSKRTVDLVGEAYFEVAKDKDHPFVVKTNKQEVEVLGTHFNINAYADEESIKTTLLEGSVKVVSTPKIGLPVKSVILTPGQMAINREDKLRIEIVNARNEIAWKNGYFVFDNENIREVMKEVSRWYDIDIEYHGDLSHTMFGGSISRAKSIEELLNKIELTGSVHFKIEGRRIIVTL